MNRVSRRDGRREKEGWGDGWSEKEGRSDGRSVKEGWKVIEGV